MNPNLGLFDMALALSTSKINSQFAFLQKKGIIKKDWKFLCNLDGDQTMGGEDPNFAIALSAWKNSLDKGLENELSTVENQIDAELVKEEPDIAKVKALQKQKSELKTLIADKQKYDIYDCALECQIAPPRIRLIQGESNKLYFEVSIEAGTLSYKKEGNIKSDTIEGTTYVFAVPIANKIVKKADVILGDTEQDKLVVDGLSDDIFRIESLFLDFQNANIAQFAAKESSINTDITMLQVALTNYFGKIINHADNPYILGYSVQIPSTVAHDALFQPTLATFSTSFSTEKRCSAFNFLMQVDDHELPKDQRRGILLQSLIERAIDKTATVNGVMAIDYNTFVEQYVDRFVIPQIPDKFEQTLRNAFAGYTLQRNANYYRLDRPNQWMEFWLTGPKITEANSEGNGIAIRWDIAIKGLAHEEVPRSDFGFEYTVGMDQRFSTHGRFPLNGFHVGATGGITVLFSASTEGKLKVEVILDKPSIGGDTATPEYTNPDNETSDALLEALYFLTGFQSLMDSLNSTNFNIHISDGELDKMRIEDLGNINNRIILPGSNVFTFKNLRLMTHTQDDQDAILFDIAYAPETH